MFHKKLAPLRRDLGFGRIFEGGNRALLEGRGDGGRCGNDPKGEGNAPSK